MSVVQMICGADFLSTIINKELSTKSFAPFKLVYYEAYRSKQDALLRESKLKHHGSVIGHLKKRVRYSALE